MNLVIIALLVTIFLCMAYLRGYSDGRRDKECTRAHKCECGTYPNPNEACAYCADNFFDKFSTQLDPKAE